MKHPRTRLLTSVALLLAAIVALGVAFFHVGLRTGDDVRNRSISKVLDTIHEMYDDMLETRLQTNADTAGRDERVVEVIASMLRPIVRAQGDDAIRSYERGFVVRLDGDELVRPRDDDSAALIYAGDLRDDAGKPLIHDVIAVGDPSDETAARRFCFNRIVDDYYYVDDITDITDNHAEAKEDLDSILRQTEDAMGGYILTFERFDDVWDLVYPSNVFKSYLHPDELGIDIDAGQNVVQRIKVDGWEYRCIVSENLEGTKFKNDVRVAFLEPESVAEVSQRACLVFAMGIASLIMTALTVWVNAAMDRLRYPVAPAIDPVRYSPARARRVALGLGVMGFIAVILLTAFIHSMTGLIAEANRARDVLETVDDMIEQDERWVMEQSALQANFYTGFARRVADLLYQNPDLETPETLEALSRFIGADYIMIYDEDGNEAMTNARFVNLSLGLTPDSSTYDFRRLLMGVKSIVHEPCVDEVTGIDGRLIGASMGDSADGGYRALIIAMPSREARYTTNTDAILRTLTTEDNLCLAVNPENDVIVYASDSEFVSRKADVLGISDAAYTDGAMGICKFGGVTWYGMTQEIDGLIYFYLTKESAVLAGYERQGLLYAGLFLVVYAMLAAALLFNYDQRHIDALAEQRTCSGDTSGQGAGAPGNIRIWWREKSPGWKVCFVTQVLFGLELIGCFVAMRAGFDIGDSEYLFTYLFGGQLRAGFNMFAYTKIAILLLGTALVVMALNLLSGMVRGTLDARGKTISLLLFNIIQYVVIGLAIYYAFLFVGINITVPLTSLAAVSFAITLLAKDTISDVLAGIASAFTNSYRIGDYVEVAGFRGRVQNITMSTTTLVNNDGNTMVVNNRDVRNVLNMSRGNSRYTIDFTVDNDQRLEEIEAILMEELPKIGKRIPEIRGDPEYLGITGLTSRGMTLTVAARCRERDYAKVRHRINAELRALFRQHEITII